MAAELVAMGFPEHRVQEALLGVKGDVGQALEPPELGGVGLAVLLAALLAAAQAPVASVAGPPVAVAGRFGARLHRDLAFASVAAV